MGNNHPFKVGITGGIGAGKSLVTKVFGLLGISIYDSDSRAKWLMGNNPKVIKEILTLFGDNAYLNKKLDTSFISKQIFTNSNLRVKLDEIVHPEVGKDFHEWVAQRSKEKYVIKEAALMFESNAHLSLNKTIVVTAPEKKRIARVLSRDTYRTEESIRGIIQSQMPEQDKLEKADYIIFNDDTKLVIPQVIQLHNIFSKQ